jgi:hypothetical protein
LNRFIGFIIVLGFCFNISAQCKSKNTSFAAGERIDYNIAYQWGFIWVDAGNVTFEASLTNYKNKPAWYFNSNGSSKPSYDWFFKVRDRFQVFTDTTTFVPFWADRTSDEGGYIVLENYVFDSERNKIIATCSASDKPKKIDTIDIKFCLNDLLNAVYYARNLDFSNCKIGEKIPIWVLVMNKVYPLYIRYQGVEVVALHDKTKYRCIKFSSKLVEGTIFKGGEDMFVWVTDDPNHVAVKIQARIVVGSVIAELIKHKGLKYPLSSKIE